MKARRDNHQAVSDDNRDAAQQGKPRELQERQRNIHRMPADADHDEPNQNIRDRRAKST